MNHCNIDFTFLDTKWGQKFHFMGSLKIMIFAPLQGRNINQFALPGIDKVSDFAMVVCFVLRQSIKVIQYLSHC